MIIQFISYIIYLPGLRPNGVSASLLDSLMVKGSYFHLIQGATPDQKLGAVDGSDALFRPFGAPRLDFWAHREGVQKSCFWGIAPKHQKSEDKSNQGGPGRHFGHKTMTFDVPFGIVFHHFCE